MQHVRTGLAKVAAAAVMFMGAATVSQAATVSVDVPVGPIDVGSTFMAAVSGSGFESLDGGGLDFLFSSSLLELLSVQIDAAWNFMPDTGVADGAGKLTGLSFNVFPMAKDGSFAIASLEFRAKAPGVASISVSENPLFVFGAGGEWVPVEFTGASVEITSAVPEPSTTVMLLAGALGLFAAVRRREKSA